MRNPFRYGAVVVGDAFCNRKQELKDVTRAMENGEKLLFTPNAGSAKRRQCRLCCFRSIPSHLDPAAFWRRRLMDHYNSEIAVIPVML